MATEAVLSAVLEEREEFEPFIRSILSNSNVTPHGPAEIGDILTHKVSVRNEPGIAGYLKGCSFQPFGHGTCPIKSAGSKKLRPLATPFLL